MWILGLEGLVKLPSYPFFSCLVVCSHQALSKNGKVYGTDIMVGVVPCIEKVGISDVCRNFVELALT